MSPLASPAATRWTLREDALVISLDGLPEDQARQVALRLDEWRECQWVEGSDLRLSPKQWSELALPPEVQRGGEEGESAQENWAALQHLLLDLIGVERQELRLDAIGIPGSAGFRLAARIDGQKVKLGELHPFGFITDVSGRLQPVLPSVTWAFVEAVGVAGAAPREQLTRCSRLHAGLGTVSTLLEGRLEFKPHGFLATFQPRIAERLLLRWEETGVGVGAVSPKVYLVNPDGSQEPLSPADLQAEGFVTTDPRRPLILPEGAGPLLEKTGRLQRRLQGDEELQKALHNPALLIPEGTNADAWLDLDEYSERVLGFERIVERASNERSEGSGIDWFDASGEGGELTGEAPARVDEDAAPVDEGTPQLGTSTAQPRSGTLAAIVKELDADPTAPAGADVFDDVVPWKELAQLLAPTVQLKDHQRVGVAWLWNHLRSGSSGVLLADDMGLGKTLQVACTLALRRSLERPTTPQLVVCPTILLENWRQELSRFFRKDVWPEIYLLHGVGLRHLLSAGTLDTGYLRAQDLILTNYETLGAYQQSLLRLDFDVVVFDEAHNLKNPDTFRSRAAQGLKREFSIALTGTPVENELQDLWSIFEAAQTRAPKVFGTRQAFREAVQGEDAIWQAEEGAPLPVRHLDAPAAREARGVEGPATQGNHRASCGDDARAGGAGARDLPKPSASGARSGR